VRDLPHQLDDSHRTPFVRRLARMLAAITRTRDRKEPRVGLRGKVAFRFPLLIAQKKHDCSVQGRLVAGRFCRRTKQCDSKANTL
jgi:hypothetical protein